MEGMKVIDAHAHLGEFGGWANVRVTAEEMIADMETFNTSKTVVFMIPNDIVREAVKRFPDRLIGFVMQKIRVSGLDEPNLKRVFCENGANLLGIE